MEGQVKDLKIQCQKSELKFEIKMREQQLRIRGLEEEEEENVREKVVSMFAELTEKSLEEMDNGLDQVFRLRSKFIRVFCILSDAEVTWAFSSLKLSRVASAFLPPARLAENKKSHLKAVLKRMPKNTQDL